MREPLPPEPAATFGQRTRQYLLSGFLVLIPIGLSVLVVGWIVGRVDRILAPALIAVLGRDIPGLGLLCTLAIVYAVGVLVSDRIGLRAVELVDAGLGRVPGVSWFYKTFKQVADAFSPESQAAFKGVVLVPYPRAGVLRLGFVTRQLHVASPESAEDWVAVYVPSNHVSVGDVALFRKADVHTTDLTVQQGIQSVLSAGAALPERLVLKL